HRQMAWKNGGGITTEIAIDPSGAGLDDFNWRLSMAQLKTPGAFSKFPGVGRLLLSLEGRIDLTIGGGRAGLTPGGPAIQFPGEAEVSADLPRRSAGGFQAALDFNVMVRRGRIAAQLRRLRFERAARIQVESDVTLVLSRTSRLAIGQHESPTVLDL